MARRPSRSKGRGRSSAAPRRASPRGALSPYEQRIANYLARHPGATRAEARGQKPGEHRLRERRAKEAGRLTEKERAMIGRFAKVQARRMDADADEVRAEMIAWAQQYGVGHIEALRDQVKDLNKRQSNFGLRRRGKVARFTGSQAGRSRNLADMDAFTLRYNLPDPRWLHYK